MARQTEKTVSLQTVGCRLNQYETEKMASELAAYGFRRVRRGEIADLYIINTCTVTHRADADNRRLIHRAVKQNPNARIVVAGCSVNHDPQSFAEMEAVALVIANEDKGRIIEILPNHFPDLFDSDTRLPHESVPAARFEQHNRAWLKVSDGCNQRCSFCIVPSVRGDLRNREPLELTGEIDDLVAAGFHEVVLTGVNLGYYRSRATVPSAHDLADLCAMILERTKVGRIRLSSIEPQAIGQSLLDVFVNAGDRVCRHLHVPLQSGSLRILKLMRRPYDANAYMQRVKAAREAIPDVVIGADVIVGFPGESEDDFEATKALVTSGLLDYLHVFRYSDRSGTPAAAMTDKVPSETIRGRHLELTQISDRLRAESNLRQVGRVLDVIAENRKPEKGQFWGIAGNYTRVKLPMDYKGGRGIVRYQVTSAHGLYVDGQLLT